MRFGNVGVPTREMGRYIGRCQSTASRYRETMIDGGAGIQVRMEVRKVYTSKRVNCMVLYRESPTWQRLAVTSRSSTSLPVVGSDHLGCPSLH